MAGPGDVLSAIGNALDAATNQSRAAQGMQPLAPQQFNSPGDFLNNVLQRSGAADIANIAGSTLAKGPQDIASSIQQGNPLGAVGGAIETGLSPLSALGRVTTESGVGSLVNAIQNHGSVGDPTSQFSRGVQTFGTLPLAAQLAAYATSPVAKVGSLAETPEVVEGALPGIKMVQQGAMSKAMGLATDNPLSQIETFYAKYNPAQLALSGVGKALSPVARGFLDMTPMGKGLYVADQQNAVVRSFGKLLSAAGVDLTPDQFRNLQDVVSSSKNADATQAAAMQLQDAEDKITQYVRGEVPGVQNNALQAEGGTLPMRQGFEVHNGVVDAQNASARAALPGPSQAVPYMSQSEWTGNVKNALKDNGDQTSYIITNGGQRYAVSPIPPGGSLRQRIFNGGEVRTQSGESVPIAEVQEIQDPQGQVVLTRPQHTQWMVPETVNEGIGPKLAQVQGQLPSARDQALLDQAHSNDYIQQLVGGLKDNPLSDNLSQRLSAMQIHPGQLANALKVRGGVAGKITQIANAQTQALDNIASNNPNLVINTPADILGNPQNLQQAVQTNLQDVNNLRAAVKQGTSYLAGGDLTNLAPESLTAGVDKGFNDAYQKSFALQNAPKPNSVTAWKNRTINPVLGSLVGTGMAMQAGVPAPLAAALVTVPSILEATAPGRVIDQSLKQSKRLLPSFLSLIGGDEAMKSYINGVTPMITPGTALSRFAQYGDVGPEAEQALANLTAKGNLNPYSKDMEDALSQIQLGPLTHQGQAQSELQQGYKGLGQLGQYINQLSGGKLGGLQDYMQKGEDSATRVMTNIDMVSRLAAALQGKDEVMGKVAPYFANSIQDMAPNTAQAITDANGAVSTNKLASLLDQDGIVGDLREKLMGQWQNLLDTGSQRGIDLANKVHYDYRYGTGMDQFMNQFILNHQWATRNLQHYPQMLAEHPWTIPMIGDYLDKLQQDRANGQGTLRFLGQQPADNPFGQVMSWLGNQPGEPWSEPDYGVSLVNQLQPLWEAAIQHSRGDNSVANTLLDTTSSLGLGLKPGMQMGLQSAGALNEKSYWPGFAMANMPINALQARGMLPMGSPLDWMQGQQGPQPMNLDPFSGAANFVREHVPGGPGFQQNLTGRQIEREVENVAIEQGLGPNSTQAKMAANDPTSPLWQEAARRVAGQHTVADFNRVLGAPEIQFESPGEQTIQKLSGDPLWQPNLSDPIEQALFAPWTLGNDRLTKAMEAYQKQQEIQYNQQRLNGAVQSPAVVELLARAAAGDPQIQQQLAQQGLSVTGGNTPSVVDSSGKMIDPELARQLFAANSGKFIPDFTQAGNVVRQTASVNPLVRRPMTTGPNPQDAQVLRQWDSADPAIRAKILADPQLRAVIARYKSGVNP